MNKNLLSYEILIPELSIISNSLYRSEKLFFRFISIIISNYIVS